MILEERIMESTVVKLQHKDIFVVVQRVCTCVSIGVRIKGADAIRRYTGLNTNCVRTGALIKSKQQGLIFG